MSLPNPQTTASPRPWRLNPAWPTAGHGADPSPILDANGNDVLPTSEWLNATDADIALIVEAVNAYEDLRTSVIAFGAPWAVKYAEEWGLPQKHLDPRHYDILKRAGARMDDFTRGSAESHD